MEFFLKAAFFILMRVFGMMILAFIITTGTFYMVGADDLIFSPYWDLSFWCSSGYGMVRLCLQMSIEYCKAHSEIYWE